MEVADEIIDKALLPLNHDTDEWKMDDTIVVTQNIRPTLR